MRSPRGVSGDGVIIHCKLVNFIKETLTPKTIYLHKNKSLIYVRKRCFDCLYDF
jgi:hypothetical protein